MSRIVTIFTLPALLSLSSPASTQPDSLGILWQSQRASLIRVACKPGDVDAQYCRAIALKDPTGTRILGTGYMRVRLLWRRRGGGAGPDVLVHGDNGGSGGLGDLFAVTAWPSASVKRYHGERLNEVRAKPRPGLQIDLPLNIEFFNGAPHAGAVTLPIPTVWRRGDFAADIPAMLHPMSKRELLFREIALEEELRNWADDNYPTARLYPPESRAGTPVAVYGLADLMLSGHADEAKAMLDRAWPRSQARWDVKLGGEQAFWKDLCRALVRHPLWKRLQLDRLPHADIIGAGAR